MLLKVAAFAALGGFLYGWVIFALLKQVQSHCNMEGFQHHIGLCYFQDLLLGSCSHEAAGRVLRPLKLAWQNEHASGDYDFAFWELSHQVIVN